MFHAHRRWNPCSARVSIVGARPSAASRCSQRPRLWAPPPGHTSGMCSIVPPPSTVVSTSLPVLRCACPSSTLFSCASGPILSIGPLRRPPGVGTSAHAGSVARARRLAVPDRAAMPLLSREPPGWQESRSRAGMLGEHEGVERGARGLRSRRRVGARDALRSSRLREPPEVGDPAPSAVLGGAALVAANPPGFRPGRRVGTCATPASPGIPGPPMLCP